MEKINVITDDILTKIEFDPNLYLVDEQELQSIILSRYLAGFSGAVNLEHLSYGLIFISFNSFNNRDHQITDKIVEYIRNSR